VLFLLNIVIGLFTPFEVDSENKQVKFIGWNNYFFKILLIILIIVALNYKYLSSIIF
jgi:hypothetical protein